jgi:hypothetical protein
MSAPATPNPRSVQPDPAPVPRPVAVCLDCGRPFEAQGTADWHGAMQGHAVSATRPGRKPIDPDDLTPEHRDALVAGFDRLLDPDSGKVSAE